MKHKALENMDSTEFRRLSSDALASTPASNDNVIPINSTIPLPKARRKSSLSQSTTVSDMLKKLRISGCMGNNEDNEGDVSTSIGTSSKRCFKCATCTSRKLGMMNMMKRRRSSSSILYSELLSNLNTNSKQVPFNLKLSVSTDTKFRQLRIPFSAKFMGSTTSNNDSSNAAIFSSDSASSPYFSEIDLNEYYINKEVKKPMTSEKRKFPGFEIPKKGKLQLIIFNNEKTMNSVILLPFDLSKLSKNHKKIVKFRIFKVITYNSDGTPTTETDSPNAHQEKIEIQKLINEIELKFINYKDKRYYLFDKIKILFNSKASSTEDYKVPLNLYSLPSKSPILKNIDRCRFQFNPKLPILPRSVISKLDMVHSDQFNVDLQYFINRCEYCGYFDKLKGLNETVSSCAISDDDDDKDQVLL